LSLYCSAADDDGFTHQSRRLGLYLASGSILRSLAAVVLVQSILVMLAVSLPLLLLFLGLSHLPLVVLPLLLLLSLE
jgi:hypothetical protein